MQGEQGGSAFMAFLPFILIFVIIYFLMIRPQTKKHKETKLMIQSLQKGDEVVTAGGIYGTIAGIKEKEGILILKIADNVKVNISRASITRKVEKAA
ncbi:preprotein translocase subunit YajC [candidate division KSB1 bacterium]|nr:preprotein translocase subunit YajC [candidate division KSB1 bacterium]